MFGREEHEALLNELLTEDLETSRKTEILQLLRNDYVEVIETHDKNTKTLAKLQADKDDLVVSNSKLFRQLGVQSFDKEAQEKEKEKSFSETITIEDLEGGN